MVRSFMLFLLLFSLATSYAATKVSLSGKVTGSGAPVANALVTLIAQDIEATTDSKGEFSITAGTGTVRNLVSASTEQISFKSGRISFSLSKSTAVNIDIFDMKGNLLKRELNYTVPAGRYHYTIGADVMAARMMVIRVTSGKSVSTFRYMPLKGSQFSASSFASHRSSASSSSAKLMATVDSLRVVASGFQTKVVAISSYEDGNVSITLDPVILTGLDKFSFFVTSLAALQDLSGSEDGFGGDLRFGTTKGSSEKGAGLLGADSICSCIAERSMPGASAKRWRAFLSVMEGPDGKQVNAIDRIGSGPWYDRLGRIVSNNTAELLNDRPEGAHQAIKNDLPNEDGVPNHRPDGEVVDNHLTITGSNSKGELYDGSGGMFGGGGFGMSKTSMFPGTGRDSENPTCNDWTSTTVQSSPRSGLSWPQAGSMGMGMSNWISVWDQSGCEPGIDLETSTGAGLPGVYTIGNGGGYGGFYCFALEP